jgi:hypothetical protein
MDNQRHVTVREESDKGDIAKSFEGLIKSHFISKRFKDIMGSTRLSRHEVMILALMEINRITAKILSLSRHDVSETVLAKLSVDEQNELKELWVIKMRFRRNPHALVFAIYDSFEYMYGLGLQSLDGLSRTEGVELVGGATQRLLDPNKMGFGERLKKRFFSNDILFLDQ